MTGFRQPEGANAPLGPLANEGDNRWRSRRPSRTPLLHTDSGVPPSRSRRGGMRVCLRGAGGGPGGKVSPRRGQQQPRESSPPGPVALSEGDLGNKITTKPLKIKLRTSPASSPEPFITGATHLGETSRVCP